MADKVNFELVSPQRLLMSEAVDMVVVPGAEGDFGVMAEHAPLISTVRPGTITVYQGEAVSDRIFVAGGFAEVTGERCTVLAEEAERLDDIDRTAVESQLQMLRSDLGATQSEDERAAVEARIAIAEAKIEALTTAVYQ
jgi:F-type H+-transporting ATPase subunit epsilon